MKRDNDLIRELLFRLEREEDYISNSFVVHDDLSEEERREVGHIMLLADQGFVALSGKYGDQVRITNLGHDFLAAIRDETVWNKTKEAAQTAGAATLGVIFDLAMAYGKKKLTETTGLSLG